MSTELLLSDKRFRWISTMYLHVATNAEHAMNPFKNLVDFLEMKVGDLWWGADQQARESLKSRFCTDLAGMMRSYGYHVPEEEVHNCLSNDELSNVSIAQRLAGFVK